MECVGFLLISAECSDEFFSSHKTMLDAVAFEYSVREFCMGGDGKPRVRERNGGCAAPSGGEGGEAPSGACEYCVAVGGTGVASHGVRGAAPPLGSRPAAFPRGYRP